MNLRGSLLHRISWAALLLATACGTRARSAAEDIPTADAPGAGEVGPRVAAASPEEAGEYLVLVGGCNDCHTRGWVETGGRIPREEWLAGSPVGFQGPWGTVYPPNLRLTAQRLEEAEWVELFRTRSSPPPMPWASLRHLSDEDLVAIHRFLRDLGPAGTAAPDAVPPDGVPQAPFVRLTPVEPPERREGRPSG